MKAKISEIFESIQGEGLYLGTAQLFVRFFGCNLSCKFCDTKLDSFIEYEPQELFKRIRMCRNGFHSIAFTGGEPLLQKDSLKEILELTSGSGYKNYLETNGTLAEELKEVIGHLDIIAMDLKLPSSSGMGNLWRVHRKFLEVALGKEVFLKAIICQATQEDDLEEAIALIKEVNKSLILVLQPDSFADPEALIQKLGGFKEACIREEVTACIIPQIHKKIGVR